LDNQYKLVIHGSFGENVKRELFDIKKDSAETNNLIHELPEKGLLLEEKLKIWQQSVLESLLGYDY
jgi:hypothetical protein